MLYNRKGDVCHFVVSHGKFLRREKRKYTFIISNGNSFNGKQGSIIFIITFYYIKWKFLSWKSRKYNFLYIIYYIKWELELLSWKSRKYNFLYIIYYIKWVLLSKEKIISNGNSMEKGKYCF